MTILARKGDIMLTTRTVRLSGQRTAVLLAVFALIIALGVSIAGTLNRSVAYADSGDLQAAQVVSLNDDQELTAQLVTGKISADGKTATMSMVYGDKTTVSTNGASKTKVKWSTSNKKVVQVKSNGKYSAKVTAKGAGKATVTAKTPTGKLKLKITVTGKLSKSTVSVNALKTTTVKLKGAKVKKWTSADKKTAKVSKKGKITPVRTGETTLTCTDTKGNKYTCKVKVTAPNITCVIEKSFSGTSSSTGNTYYYKQCKLTNKSGKKIVLNNSNFAFWPDVSYTNSYVTHSAFSLKTGNFFSKKPVTVASNKSYEFYAASTESTTDGSRSVFMFYMKIGSAKYAAMFSTGGQLLVFGRA